MAMMVITPPRGAVVKMKRDRPGIGFGTVSQTLEALKS